MDARRRAEVEDAAAVEDCVAEAYQALGRTTLTEIAEAHRRHRDLPDVLVLG